jgi:hypothetical protein
MIKVNIDGGYTLTFPDDTVDSIINKTVKDFIAQQHQKTIQWYEVPGNAIQQIGASFKQTYGRMQQSLAAMQQHALDKGGGLTTEEYAKLSPDQQMLITPPTLGFKPKTTPEEKAQRQASVTKLSNQGKQISQSAESTITELNENIPKGSALDYSLKVINGFIQQSPGLAASVISGSPAPALAWAGVTSFANTTGEQLEKGTPYDEALLLGASNGTIDLTTGMIPIKYFLEPGSNIFKTVGRQVLGNMTFGEAGELMKIGLDKGTINPNMSWNDAWNRLKETGIVSAGSGILQGTSSFGVHKLITPQTTPEPSATEAAKVTQTAIVNPDIPKNPKWVELTSGLSPEEKMQLSLKRSGDSTDGYGPYKLYQKDISPNRWTELTSDLSTEEKLQLKQDLLNVGMKVETPEIPPVQSIEPPKPNPEYRLNDDGEVIEYPVKSKKEEPPGYQTNDEGDVTSYHWKPSSKKVNAIIEKEAPTYVKTTPEDIQSVSDFLSKPTEEQNKNLISKVKNLNSPEEVQNVINKIAEDEAVTNNTVKGVRTLDSVQREAKAQLKDTGYSLDELKWAHQSMEKLVPMIQKWKMVLDASARHLYELKDAYDKDSSNINKVKFAAHIEYHRELEGTFLGLQANTSRALGSNRLHVNGENFKFDDIANTTMDDNPLLKDEIDARANNISDAELKKASKSLGDTPKKLAEVGKRMRTLKGSTLGNVLLESSNANILGSLSSHVVSFMSNSIKAILRTGQLYAEAGYSKLRGIPMDERKTLAEVNARAAAMGQAALEMFIHRPFVGLKNLPNGLKESIQGKTVSEILKECYDSPLKLEEYINSAGIENEHSKANDAAPGGGAFRAISKAYLEPTKFGQLIHKLANGDAGIEDMLWGFIDRYGAMKRSQSYGLLSIVDQPFKYIHYMGEVAGQIYKRAVKNGLSGKELEDYVDKLTQDVVTYRDTGNLPNAPKEQLDLVKDIHQKGIEEALEGTYQQDLTGTFAKKINEGLQSSPWAKLLGVRFFKTSVNFFKENAQMVPILGSLQKEMRKDLSGVNGREAQSRAMVKQMTGALLYTSGMILIATGRLTGKSAQPVQTVRNAAQIPNDSIDLTGKGKFIDINRLDPYSTPWILMSDLAEMKDYVSVKDAGILTDSLILTLANSAFAKTYLTQMGDLYSTLKQTVGASNSTLDKGNYLKSLIGSFVPFGGMIGSVTKGIDSNQRTDEVNQKAGFIEREAALVFNQIKSKYTPWLLKTKLNPITGEELKNETGIGGLRNTTARTDSPGLMLLAHAGIVVQPTPDNIFGVQLTPEQHWEFQRMVDTKAHLRQRLDEYARSVENKPNTTVGEVNAVTKALILGARQQAAAAMFMKYPELLKQLPAAKLKPYQPFFTKLNNTGTNSGFYNWKSFLKPAEKPTSKDVLGIDLTDTIPNEDND